MKAKNGTLLPQLGLLLVSLIWGSAFVVVKNTTAALPASLMIAMRFGIAALMILLFFPKRLKYLNHRTWKAGAVIGILFYAAYYLQTVGVQYTTAGKNAFLTAIYVVLVPFLCWMAHRRRPGANSVAAAVLCIAGIGVLSLKQDFSINFGDFLSLLCGVAFAAQIVATGIYVQKLDPILLTFTQFVCTAGFAAIGALGSGQITAVWDGNVILSLFYIGVFSTFAGLFLQTICQKKVAPARASLILSLESVFGCLFGALFLQESITPKALVGFALIFAAIFLSEANPSFFQSRRQKNASGKVTEPSKQELIE